MKEKEAMSTICEGIGGIGVSMAMILSFALNESILWAILHGTFSWFYVIYYVIKY